MREFKGIEDFIVSNFNDRFVSEEIESIIENHMKNYLYYTEEVKEYK